MGIKIICGALCKECQINHVKDPSCMGDYTIDGKLLSFCPECGKMLPYLEQSSDSNFKDLSNGEKRKIGTSYAKKHNLDYKKVNEIVKTLYPVTDNQIFLDSLKFDLKVIFNVDI